MLRSDIEIWSFDKTLHKDFLFCKNCAEKGCQNILPDPFLTLVNSPKQSVQVKHFFIDTVF